MIILGKLLQSNYNRAEHSWVFAGKNLISLDFFSSFPSNANSHSIVTVTPFDSLQKLFLHLYAATMSWSTKNRIYPCKLAEKHAIFLFPSCPRKCCTDMAVKWVQAPESSEYCEQNSRTMRCLLLLMTVFSATRSSIQRTHVSSF